MKLTHHEIALALLAFAEQYAASVGSGGDMIAEADLINALTEKIIAAEAHSYQHAYELGRRDGQADAPIPAEDLAARVARLHDAADGPRAPEAYYPTLPAEAALDGRYAGERWTPVPVHAPTGFHGSTVPN